MLIYVVNTGKPSRFSQNAPVFERGAVRMVKPVYPWMLLFLLFTGFFAVNAYADDPGVLRGTWQGKIKKSMELQMIFRIERNSNGTYGGKMDCPGEGLKDIPINRITFNNGQVRLEVNAIGGLYEGNLTSGQTKMDGIWTKGGTSWPLILEKMEENNDWARPQDPQNPFPFDES